MHWNNKDSRIKAVSKDESVGKSAGKNNLRRDPKQVEHRENV